MKNLVKIAAMVISFMGYEIQSMNEITLVWQKPHLVTVNIYAVLSGNHKFVCFARHPPRNCRAIQLFNINVTETIAQQLMMNGPGAIPLVPELYWDDKNEMLYYYETLVYAGNVASPIIKNDAIAIGDNAFYNCFKLQKIAIPPSVHRIGHDAFGECRQLSEVTINFKGKIGFSLGDCAFYECASLEKIKLPAEMSIIPTKAFYNCCNLRSINIPISVRSIDKCAFYGCNLLSNVEFPIRLECINSKAFWGCSLLKVVHLFSGCTVEPNAFGQNVDIVIIRKEDIVKFFSND